jgi:hypothetical protein
MCTSIIETARAEGMAKRGDDIEYTGCRYFS